MNAEDAVVSRVTQGLLGSKHGLLVHSVLLGSKEKEAGTDISLTGKYFWHGKPSTCFADTYSLRDETYIPRLCKAGRKRGPDLPPACEACEL